MDKKVRLNITAGGICLNAPCPAAAVHEHSQCAVLHATHNGDNGFGCFLFRTLFAAKWNIPTESVCTHILEQLADTRATTSEIFSTIDFYFP